MYLTTPKQTVGLLLDGYYPIPNCPKSDIESVPHEIFTRTVYRNIPSLGGGEGERVEVGGGGGGETRYPGFHSVDMGLHCPTGMST